MTDDRSNARSRRRFLSTLATATGTAALAGCSGGSGGSGTATESPTRTAEPTTTDVDGMLLGYDVAIDHDTESWDGYDPDWEAPTTEPSPSLTADPLVENLEIPWDLSFAADGTLFVTERVGRIRTFEDGELQTVAEPAEVVDAESVDPGTDESSWWVEGGEGGTLGIAAHPRYPDPPIVYAYYTYLQNPDEDERRNRVVAYDMAAEAPSETETTIVDGIPGGNIHNGGRLEFGPANYLWITTSEGGEGAIAADRSSLGGKVLRVRPDGRPAPDNPDIGGDPRIYTYGHRNPQSVVWLPDGTPATSEHGPAGHDEINRLEAGANYGWPTVRRPSEYLEAPDVHRPMANTLEETWAPSGAVFYTGDAVPSLQNRMLVGGLAGQRLIAATLTPAGAERPPVGDGRVFDGDHTDDAYTATAHSLLTDELGRIRHVEQGPNGELYVVTSNRDGRAGEGFPTERDDVLVRLREE